MILRNAALLLALLFPLLAHLVHTVSPYVLRIHAIKNLASTVFLFHVSLLARGICFPLTRKQ